MLPTTIAMIAVVAEDFPAMGTFPEKRDIRILVGGHGGKRHLPMSIPCFSGRDRSFEGCKTEVGN